MLTLGSIRVTVTLTVVRDVVLLKLGSRSKLVATSVAFDSLVETVVL